MPSFCVTGEFLTETARNFVLEGSPDRAFQLLQCVGDGQCTMPVLSGKKRLVGDSHSGISFDDELPDVSAAYIQDVERFYAGRMRINKQWYRPKAYVTGGNKEDARYAFAVTGRGIPLLDNQEAMHQFGKARVDYYCYPGEIVVALNQPTRLGGVFAQWGAHTIFEPCGEIPVWMTAPSSPSEALRRFRAAGYELEEREPHRLRRAPRRLVDGGRAADREAADEEAERRREEEELQRLRDYQKEILKRAGSDLFLLKWGDKEARVPRVPFECYALSRCALRQFMPPWTPVCPQGMKLMMDNQLHTDWMVGAGLFEFTAYYRDDALQKAVLEEVARIQEHYGSFQCAVLNDAGEVTGVIGEEVLVLPNLDPNHLQEMVDAKAVITEAGGAAAHLVSVAREKGLTIVRDVDARKKYGQGMLVNINPAEGKVRVFTFYGDDHKPFIP